MNHTSPMDDEHKFTVDVAYVEGRMNEAVREAPLDPMTRRFMKFG